MKTAITTLIGLAVLLSTGAAVHAESESANGRPFMGVLLDPAPLPGLLSKHLGLPVGEELLDKCQKLMEEVLDKYQKQMCELRKSMEELEERQGEILDRICGQRDEKEPKEGEESARPRGQDGQGV